MLLLSLFLPKKIIERHPLILTNNLLLNQNLTNVSLQHVDIKENLLNDDSKTFSDLCFRNLYSLYSYSYIVNNDENKEDAKIFLVQFQDCKGENICFINILNETKTDIELVYRLEQKQVIYDYSLCHDDDNMVDIENLYVQGYNSNKCDEALHHLMRQFII